MWKESLNRSFSFRSLLQKFEEYYQRLSERLQKLGEGMNNMEEHGQLNQLNWAPMGSQSLIQQAWVGILSSAYML